MSVPNFKRPAVPSGDTPGNVMFDGKRMRKAVHRKTLDYNSSVLQFLNNRIWQRDQRDFRAIQPDALYQLDLVPPTSMLDNPMNCVTTKFIRTSTNKFRCPIFCLAWTPEGRRLVTGASSGEFTLWNGLTFNFETILQAHDASVRSMVWSHNNTWMVTGDHSGFIKYWQTNMNNVKMYQGHKEPVRGISFCPTDSKFSTCSDDGTIRIWDFLRCHEEKILRGHGADVKCVDWHPQKCLLASGSKDNQQPIKLWDPKSGNSLATIHGHKATVMELKWNKNGNWLLTASRDHLIKLFDIRNMKEEMQTFKGHKKEATSISWHPVHEGLFVSGGFDGAIMFWMVGTDRELGAMEEAHEGMVWSLAWHPLGHILASGSNDHTTKFWTRNRPGDRMRDRYNLNTLPGGSEHELPEFDLETVYAPVIPGMGIGDKNEKTEANNNSKVEVEHEEPAIPGLDWSADEEFLRQQDRHQPRKKVPYARPIPRNFEEAWTTNKQPKDFRNEEVREEEERPNRKGRDRRDREDKDKRRGDRDREINGDSRDMRKRNRRGKRHDDYDEDDDDMMQQDGPRRFQDQGMPPDQRMRGGGNQGPGGPMRHQGPGMQGPMDQNMGPGNPNSLLGQGPQGMRMQGPGMNQQPRPLMFNDGMQSQRMGNPQQQQGGMMPQQGGMGQPQFGGPRPLMQQGGMGPPQQQRFMGPGQQQQGMMGPQQGMLGQQGMMGQQQGMMGQQQGMMGGPQQGMMGGPQQGMMGPPRMQGPGQQQGGPLMGPQGMSQGQNPRMRGPQEGGQFQGGGNMNMDQDWNQGPSGRGNKENQENDFRNDRDFRHSNRKDEFSMDRDDRSRGHGDWGSDGNFSRNDERSRGKGDRGPGRGGMQDQQQGFRDRENWNSQNDRFRNNDQDNRFGDNDDRFNQNDQIEMMDYDERSDSRHGGGGGQSSDFNRNFQGGRGPDRSQRGGFRSGGGGQRGNDDRNRQGMGDQPMDDFNRQGQFEKGFKSGGNQMQFQNQQGGFRDSNFGGGMMEMHQGGWGDRQQQQQRGSPGRGGQRNRSRGDMGGRGGGGGGGRGGGFRGGGQRSGR